MTVFDRIYAGNHWNGVESKSGPGSGTAATTHVAQAITDLVAELGVRSVLDAACGDSWWQPDLPGYIGVDVAREAIAVSKRRHPDRAYRLGDIARMPLPPSDLIIFRDALQHMSLADGFMALAAIRASKAQWLLASTYVGGQNVDIRTGGCYSPDLTASPFAMGEPERLIPDGYDYFDPNIVRDPTKMLGLWRL